MSADFVPIALGELYTLEITAVGNRVTTSVNGKQVAEYLDDEESFKSGELTLVCRGDSVIQYRDVLIAEAPFESGQVPFKPLFNGHNLSGWTFPFGNDADWSVENGQLVGVASVGNCTIATERADYGDFHLRMEVSTPDQWNKHIVFRSIPDRNNDVNYRFQLGGQRINSTEIAPRGDYFVRTFGSFNSRAQTTKEDLECIKPPNGPAIASTALHNIEVLAQENVFRLIIDGKEASAFRDEKSRLRKGRIEIRLLTGSKVSIRRIEIKELQKTTDVLQPGTVWIGEHVRIQRDTREAFAVTFRVLQRDGETFKARFEGSNNVREVRGSVKNGEIRWLAKDVTVIKGHKGHDHSGTIRGEEISLKYSGVAVTNGEAVSGTVTLRLEKPTPF